MKPTSDASSPAVAIGDADASARVADASRLVGHHSGWSRLTRRRKKPNRDADVAPHIAVTLAELARIARTAGAESASLADLRSNPRRGLGEAMKPLRVLVVEDDLMIGPLLAEMFEELGHVVCAVEVEASAAVAAARRCRPDLMIVDVGLGDASAIAAVKEILEEGLVPHVFVTGDVLRGLSLGPDAVLIQKPYRGSDLVAAIERAIGGRTS